MALHIMSLPEPAIDKPSSLRKKGFKGVGNLPKFGNYFCINFCILWSGFINEPEKISAYFNLRRRNFFRITNKHFLMLNNRAAPIAFY